MIHHLTVLRLPEFNNSLLTKNYASYSNLDYLSVNVRCSKTTYFYLVHRMGVFNSVADCVVSRTWNVNHRICL